MHKDNQTIVKECIYSDKVNLLNGEITTIDNAFTRPWTVTKFFMRQPSSRSGDQVCAENNAHVFIGGQDYFVGADGLLTPVRKAEPPTCGISISRGSDDNAFKVGGRKFISP
jgi:hypothetical protein